MSAARNKKLIMFLGAVFTFLVLSVSTVYAQTYGGSTSSSLYSNSNSSYFQSTSAQQDSGNTAQLTTDAVTLQQLTVTGAITVVGTATPVIDSTDNKEGVDQNTSNELMIVLFLFGFAGIAIVYILLRQLKTAK
jgi:hypothetical protein